MHAMGDLSTPDLKEREEFLQTARKLREEVNKFRVKHKIEYPPEYPKFKINDWIVTYKI
jgi:ribosomal protein L19E